MELQGIAIQRSRNYCEFTGGAIQLPGITQELAGGARRRRGAGIVPAATANADVASGTGREKAGRDAIRRGMQLFIENEVEASLAEFEAALELDPSQIPYLWQRGLSLFYLNRFAEASQQFRACIAANSRDAEESIWCFVSEARESMPEVPRDPGKVLRAAYDMFKTGADPLLVLAAAGDDEGGSSAFYARLYVGLFFEIMGDEATSRKYIQSAAATEYACRSSDYMAAVARVHCLRRQWQTCSTLPPSCASAHLLPSPRPTQIVRLHGSSGAGALLETTVATPTLSPLE
ncbi:unnamed protein product [Closterium sp. Naga37s-1]|nr:unnamed protein product [Closterium sp. Naga37s-1]